MKSLVISLHITCDMQLTCTHFHCPLQSACYMYVYLQYAHYFMLGSADLNAIAMALAGYTDDKSALWREISGSLKKQLNDPYLRAMFTFLTAEDLNYDEILVSYFPPPYKFLPQMSYAHQIGHDFFSDINLALTSFLNTIYLYMYLSIIFCYLKKK